MTSVSPLTEHLAPGDLCAFLFPGTGSGGTPDLRALAAAHPAAGDIVAAALDAVDRAPHRLPPMRTILLERPDRYAQAADEPGVAQLAGYAVSVAIDRVLRAAGITPARAVGVSFGEIAALVCAGAFDITQGAAMAAALIPVLRRHGAGGGLVLVEAGPDRVRGCIDAAGAAQVEIACRNAPAVTVVSGPEGPLTTVQQAARDQGLRAVRLAVPYLSHHPAMAGADTEWLKAIRRHRQRPLRLPVHSPVHGRAYRDGDDLHRALADCIVMPVDLPQALRAAHQAGVTLFVEAGAGDALSRCVPLTLPGARTLTPLPARRTTRPDPARTPATSPAAETPGETAGHAGPAARGEQAARVERVEREQVEDSGIAALTGFLRGPRTAKTHTRLLEAIPAEFFDHPDGLAPRQRQALTYDRLRRAGLAAPPAAELLDDPPTLCALLERAAIADPALFHLMLLHYTLVLGPILRFGADQRGPRHTRDALESMTTFGALMMTEIGRSNSHLAPRTTARFDPAAREFVLTTPDPQAAKFPTNAAHPHIPKTAAIYARLLAGGRNRGVFVFIAPLRGPGGAPPPGVRIVPAPDTFGLPVDYAAVHLDGLRLPYTAWLRDGARFDADGTFHDPDHDPGHQADHDNESTGGGDQGPAGRLTRAMSIAPPVWRSVIAASAGVTRAAAAMLLHHTTGRSTLGRLAPERPLIGYRNQQEAVLGALAAGYALTAVARHAAGHRASRATPGTATWAPWSAVDRDLALLKTAATAAAGEIVTACRVHCGAPGFAATDRLNAYRGLTHAYLSAGGDNQLILFDTARSMAAGDRYRPPRVPAAPPDGGDLLSPRMWLHLAGGCEQRLHRRLRTNLAAADSAGTAGTAAVWSDNLALAAQTGTALADRMVLQIMADALPGGPPLLRPLFQLHALGWMERRLGLLLDEGLLAPGSTARLRALRHTVCDRLAPHTTALAAAFDLPAALTPSFTGDHRPPAGD